MNIPIAIRVLVASTLALAIGYGVYSITQVRKSEAPEMPAFREKLSLLQQNFPASHPDLRRLVKMIAELERDPASILGRWVQLDKTTVWEFRDDGAVYISTPGVGIASGKYASISHNIVRLDFGRTNTHTGLVHRRVADGRMTLVDATGKTTILGWRQ